MTDVLIKRELLERIDETAICDGMDATISDDLFTRLVAALAAPRQPEGDNSENPNLREGLTRYGLGIVGGITAFVSADDGCMVLHDDHLRSIAELQAKLDDPDYPPKYSRRLIAELREECEHLKACQENDMLHMTGLVAERDTLRQQLAERDAAIEEWSGTAVQNGMECDRLAANLDKLAGLLADVKADYTHAIHWEDMHAIMKRIDAALAEVKP